MRPTIPLGPWRLAIDLAASRAVNALDVHPPCGRTCDDCQRWAQLHETLLSSELADELRRVGVDPARPSDVYGAPDFRVTYYGVGRILSGPSEFIHYDSEGSSRNYEVLRREPGVLALAVAYQESVAPAAPAWATAEYQPLIAIDLWFVAQRTHPTKE